MSYEVIINSLQSAYDWLFDIFFPRIIVFFKSNELVSAALIVSFVVPALFFIFSFFIDVSYDAEFFTSKAIKNKRYKAHQEELKEQRQKIYYNRNKYRQAFYNSQNYDKKD